MDYVEVIPPEGTRVSYAVVVDGPGLRGLSSLNSGNRVRAEGSGFG